MSVTFKINWKSFGYIQCVALSRSDSTISFISDSLSIVPPEMQERGAPDVKVNTLRILCVHKLNTKPHTPPYPQPPPLSMSCDINQPCFTIEKSSEYLESTLKCRPVQTQS